MHFDESGDDGSDWGGPPGEWLRRKASRWRRLDESNRSLTLSVDALTCLPPGSRPDWSNKKGSEAWSAFLGKANEQFDGPFWTFFESLLWHFYRCSSALGLTNSKTYREMKWHCDGFERCRKELRRLCLKGEITAFDRHSGETIPQAAWMDRDFVDALFKRETVLKLFPADFVGPLKPVSIDPGSADDQVYPATAAGLKSASKELEILDHLSRRYTKRPFVDFVSDGVHKDTFNAINAILDENGGRRPIHFRKRIAWKISQSTRLLSKRIEVSQYEDVRAVDIPGSVNKQITRFFELEEAYKLFHEKVYPQVSRLPLDASTFTVIDAKLRDEGVKKDGVKDLLSKLSQMVEASQIYEASRI